MKHITDLDNDKAKQFFLKSESYINFDLPKYFDFSILLQTISNTLGISNLSDFYKKKDEPYKHENVNHCLYANKHNKYSWRALQIINPAIYVSLVNDLTNIDNFESIKKKFKDYQSDSCISCMSIPVISSSNKKSDKAEQIYFWWEHIEQESLKLALEFNYVIHTDIANCYESIYTHTISWAIHGKEEAKKRRNETNLIGNRIDKALQGMNYGQTNGIPQGSVLSDFIVEIILGHIDSILSKKIEEKEIKRYKILRYRDDYRIFTKRLSDGEEILKILYETLLEFNFKLNDDKTHIESDLILSALKEDKLEYIATEKNYSKIQDELLMIYKFSNKYPNSGHLSKWLIKIYNKIGGEAIIDREKKEVLISILTEIMYKNPKTIPICIAIISVIFQFLEENIKSEIIENIQEKFSQILNVGFLEIWLQRLTYSNEPDRKYNEKLCKKVQDANSPIWNVDWLNENLKNILNTTPYVKREELSGLSKNIEQSEIDIFFSRVSNYV